MVNIIFEIVKFCIIILELVIQVIIIYLMISNILKNKEKIKIFYRKFIG